MQQPIVVTSQPEAEPLTLAEAKTHLRIDHDSEDNLIRTWIKAAREHAEVHCQRRFVTQTVAVKLDSWPDDGVVRLDGFGGGDVTAVTSITYLDTAGDEQTVSTADYQYALDHNPPLIAPAPDGDWPDVEEDRYYPITITLTVGRNPPDCPAAVKQAMFLALAYWDENRGGESGESETARGLPAGAIRLLDSMWTGAYC